MGFDPVDVGFGVCAALGYAVVTPAFSTPNALLCSPLSTKVHAAAYKAMKEASARKTLGLLYFAKPVDRIIQAAVAPIFNLIRHFARMKYLHAHQEHAKLTLRIVLTPVAVPLYLLKGILEAVGLLLNAALQLGAPYQMIYALVRGKEATREFFDVQEHLRQPKNLPMPVFKSARLPRVPPRKPIAALGTSKTVLVVERYSGILRLEKRSNRYEEQKLRLSLLA